MSEENLLCKKYFVFKLPDYINNTFHFIEKKRMDSLELYLMICINTYDEISRDFSNEKLKKAYEALLNGLLFILKNHPFLNIKYFSKDFLSIKEQIKSAAGKDSKSLFNSINSLYKKVKSFDIAEGYIEVLQSVKIYKQVDILISFLLSDLIFKGYSLNFIKEWFKENFHGCENFYKDIESGKVDQYINKLKQFNFEEKEFEIIKKISIVNPEKKEQIKIYFAKHHEIIENKEDYQDADKLLEDDNCLYVKIKVSACDIYKAICIANRSAELLINSFKLLPGSGYIKNDNQCGLLVGNVINKIDGRVEQNMKLLNFVDRKQKERVEKFFDLRFDSHISVDDLQIVERVLHTIENAKTLDN